MKHWIEFPFDGRNVYVNLSNVRCVFSKRNEPNTTIFQFHDSNYYITVDMPYGQVMDKIKHSI